MSEQSFENHSRMVPLFHFFLSGVLLLALVGALANCYRAWQRSGGRLEAGIIVLLTIATVLTMWYARVFPLVAQDRAIKAEENLRHYVLAGTLLDPRLTVRQIVGLRFASDEEFVALASKAADEGLSETDIKKSVVTWRADTYRV